MNGSVCVVLSIGPAARVFIAVCGTAVFSCVRDGELSPSQ